MSDENPRTKVEDALADQTVSVNAPVGATNDLRPDTLKPGVPAPSSAVQVPGYRILSVLGRGGMGVVYKAIQEKANRPVALKMILAGAHADAQEQMRFRVEAEAAARLSHPNIVQLYEVGDTPDGFPFFSLEFVAGGTLAEHLKQGPLRPNDTAALVESLARAMQYAHEHGIVHRDLKPLNILLGGGKTPGAGGADKETMIKDRAERTINSPEQSTSGSSASGTADPSRIMVPKISDFGLAKQLDREDGLTRTGAIMGSPAYMAPEQAFGQSKNVGPAADIYALGAILYECLTGRPPFKGATVADTLEQVRTMEPITVRAFVKEIPRDLETICLHCLHKDPQRRYASAEALADDLRRYQEHKPITVRPVSTAERALRWCRRNPGWAAMIALVAASLVGVAGVSLFAYFEVSAQYVVVETKRQEADAERKKAEKARDEAKEAREKEKEKTLLAEARGEQSLKAVGLFATDARMYCEDAMVPGESRARLYGVLIKQLEKQADQAARESTIDALRNKTFMYQTLCAVTLDFGDQGKSKEWFDKGIASVDQWLKIRPGDPVALGFHATLLNLHANSLRVQKKFDEARQPDTEALEIRRRLVGDPDVELSTKVDAISKLADSLDSLEQFEESLVLREKICRMYEKDEKEKKEFKEAKERSFPYREALCWTYLKAALHANEYAKRKACLIKADEMSEELWNERKSNRNLLLRWATIAKIFGELEYNHGKLAERDGKSAEAEKYFAQAKVHYEKLKEHTRMLVTSKELVDGVRDYSRSFYTLGLVEKRNGNPAKARAYFELSRAIREQTLHDYAGSAGSAHLELDLCFSQIALGERSKTMERIENLVWAFMAEPDAAYRLACLYALAVDTIQETRKPAPLTEADKRLQTRYRHEAIKCLCAAHDRGFTDFFQSTIDADLGALRDDPRLKEFEATHHYQLGVLAKKRGDAKQARAYFEKAQDLAREWMKSLSTDPRQGHVKIVWLCAHVQLGHCAEAIQSADELRPKLKRGPGLFGLARVYSLASAAADDPNLQEQCRTKTLTALNQAVDVGLLQPLLTEDDLEPIRGDPRFQETLRLYRGKGKTR